MIFLERSKPHKLSVIEVLLRRAILSETQESFLKDLAFKQRLGFDGEQYADKYWQDLRLSNPHALLHGFETTYHKMFHHQMDTVFVCENFILIAELKYIAGELSYDEDLHQLWRDYNGQRLVVGDPFAQVARHEMWMTNFLMEIGIDIPVMTAVIVTAKSAFLKKMPQRFHVFKLEGLSLKLQDFMRNTTPCITPAQIELIAQQLLNRHEPKRWDWETVLMNIDIIDGAICNCGSRMYYVRGKFMCENGHVSMDVMYEALDDFRLINNDWITNKQLRDYLGISSSDTAFKYLKKITIEARGANKGRSYKIDPKIREKYKR